MATLKENLQTAVTSKPLQYLLIGVLVIGTIYWVSRSRGIEAGQKVENKYPEGPDQAPLDWQRVTGQVLVSTAYNALNGVSVDFWKKNNAMSQLLALSDQQLIWVAKEYLRRYSRTLQKDIEDETFWGLTNDQTHVQVLNRLRNLTAAKLLS